MSESNAVLVQLQKDYGSQVGTVGAKKYDVSRIPTGIFQFDLATGGGIPQGRVSIVYGAESSGKTSIAYLVMGHCQRSKQKAVFIDLESTFDPDWASRCGVDVNSLIVMTPDTAEQAVDIAEAMLHAEDVGIVALDSIAAMVTENELNSEAGKMQVAGSSMLCGKLIRKSVAALAKQRKRQHQPAFLCLNQTRYKIGVMYGDPETFPGGQALRFASSLTVRLHGKDKYIKEVHPVLPVFKETTATVRKWKVPIVARAFEYEMCLIPHDGLQVGQSLSWNTVSNFLKQYGLLYKEKTVWKCMGKSFKTLAELGELYGQNEGIRLKLQAEVTTREMEKATVDSSVTVKVDKETGEILDHD